MWWYFLIIVLICLDFGIEYLLKCKNLIVEDCKTKPFGIKILNFIFRYRLITIITLVFFSTFKAMSVGLDTQAYCNYYNLLLNDKSLCFKTTIGSKYEIGFMFLNSLCAIMNLNFRVVLFVISLFVSIVLVVFVNKVSSNKWLSLILYLALGVFAQSLSAMRQIVAMAFVLLAIMFMVDKKWIKSTLMIICAAIFHISALVCLVVIPIYYIKPKWWVVVTMFALAIAGAFAFPYVLQLIEKFTVLDYYTEYFINDTQYLNSMSLINTLYSVALIIVFMVLYLCKFKLLKLDEKDKKLYDFLLMIFVFVPIFRVVGFITNIPELLNRLNMYFFLSLLVLIPLFLKGLKHNKKLYSVASIMVLLVAAGYMYYLYAIKLSCGVVPYTFKF